MIKSEFKKYYRLYTEKNEVSGEIEYFEIFRKYSPTKEKLVEKGMFKHVACGYLENLTGWDEKAVKEVYTELV